MSCVVNLLTVGQILFGYRTYRATLASFLLVAGLATAPKADVTCVSDAAGCCCRGARGNVDCDADDLVDVIDLLVLIDHLFLSMEPLPSIDEANADGVGTIDISDISVLITYLYCSGAPPASCLEIVNHSPQTTLWALSSQPPYFDADLPGFGLPFYWSGNDRFDHPYSKPPLTYDWRVYGPYDSTRLDTIIAQFQQEVFVTPTGQVFQRGKGASIRWCDTTWIIGPPNELVVECYDMLIDTVTVANRFGWLEQLLDFQSPLFQNDSSLNRIAMRSEQWLTDTSAEVYNLFRDAPHDTTIVGSFVFWIRARDADDTTIFDPVPACHRFEAYDPMFERGVLIADAGVTYSINARIKDSATVYWQRAMHHWNPTVNVDTLTVSRAEGNMLPFVELLKHRVVILLNDETFAGVAGSAPVRLNLQKAMSAGMNAWLCGRNSLAGQEGALPSMLLKFPATTSSMYGLYSTQYSGWQFYAEDSTMRIEDFIGANAIDSTVWPNLLLDTALLHANYDWSYYPIEPNLAALPEVNHVIPTAGVDVLYTYKSRYTSAHPMLPLSAYQEGKPVMTRIDRVSNRVVVSAFTPYAFDNGASPSSPMQIVVDSVMNWMVESGVKR